MSKEISDKFKNVILNEEGPNREQTQELIEALSTVPKSSIGYNHAQEIIRKVKAGYKLQTGTEYDSNNSK